METLGSGVKNFLWEVVDDHISEEENNHDEIGLRGLYFNLLDEGEKRVGREGLSDYPHLIMLMKICPGYCK